MHNSNPYSSRNVTVSELLGEDDIAPKGSENALRAALVSLGKKGGK